jgi:recombinational DNA repair protein (RecF pathway)
MDAHMLDGNAVAGLLREAFAVEMTTALETCAGCGVTEPLGAVHVYRGAGIVLRCPHCSKVIGAIVRGRAQTCISMDGAQALEFR